MFNDLQKAEIRASLDDAIEGAEIKDDLEVVGRFKYAYCRMKVW